MTALPQIDLELRESPPDRPAAVRRQLRGVECEHVALTAPVAFDYAWNGETNYLALHDIRLRDGLAFLDSREPQRIHDLRNRMTFAPQGATIEGWSALSGAGNSYTALFFRSDLLQTELGEKAPLAPARPALYFEHPGLLAAMTRLQKALASPQEADPVRIETLALMCALELARSQGLIARADAPATGRLSARGAATVRHYIGDNLHRPVTLDELAALVDLSRFHFLRAFRQTFGAPPHQYLIMQRVARATDLLVYSTAALSEIASAAGFTSQQQFTAAFSKATGVAPGQFRRRLGEPGSET